mgnify:FL=1
MPRSNDEKTREFQQKMRTQGAAGFAAGPWNEIEESLGMDQSVVVDQEGNPVWSVKHTRKPRHAVSRSTFDRLVGGVAVLATATLVTSVMAIYFEQTREPGSSQLARTDTTADRDTRNTIVLPQPPTTGFIERPAVEVVARTPAEPDIAKDTLTAVAPAAGTVKLPVEAATDTDQRLPGTAPATGAGAMETVVAPAEATATLAQIDTQQSTPAVNDPDPAVDSVETTVTLAQLDSQQSTTDVVNSGPDTADALSVMSPDTAEDIEAITLQASPAAIGETAKPQITESTYRGQAAADTELPGMVTNAGMAPMAVTAPDTATVVETPVAVEQAAAPDVALVVTPPAETALPVDTLAMLETETSMIPNAAGNTDQSEQNRTAVSVAGMAETGEAVTASDTGTVSQEETPAAGTTQLAQLEPAGPVPSSPASAAATGLGEITTVTVDDVPQPGATGRWIINLASYAGPKTAARMQRKFEDLGVSTDKQVAEVNGKTMYRLRIASFESRRDAENYFDSIKETLGLKSAWITKQ